MQESIDQGQTREDAESQITDRQELFIKLYYLIIFYIRYKLNLNENKIKKYLIQRKFIMLLLTLQDAKLI